MEALGLSQPRGTFILTNYLALTGSLPHLKSFKKLPS